MNVGDNGVVDAPGLELAGRGDIRERGVRFQLHRKHSTSLLSTRDSTGGEAEEKAATPLSLLLSF